MVPYSTEVKWMARGSHDEVHRFVLEIGMDIPTVNTKEQNTRSNSRTCASTPDLN
jgi:hypothetical protein